MDPLTIAGIGAGIGTVGSMFGQHSANQSNLRIAREQMAFQKEMSNTAYQRATADMRAAGINPMLAVSMGGASTPPGASAQAQNELQPLERTASSAVEVARNRQMLDNLKQDENTGKAQQVLNEAQAIKAVADAKLSASSAKNAEINGKLLSAQVPEAEIKRNYAQHPAGKALKYTKMGTSDVMDIFSDLIKPFKKSAPKNYNVSEHHHYNHNHSRVKR